MNLVSLTRTKYLNYRLNPLQSFEVYRGVIYLFFLNTKWAYSIKYTAHSICLVRTYFSIFHRNLYSLYSRETFWLFFFFHGQKHVPLFCKCGSWTTCPRITWCLKCHSALLELEPLGDETWMSAYLTCSQSHVGAHKSLTTTALCSINGVIVESYDMASGRKSRISLHFLNLKNILI